MFWAAIRSDGRIVRWPEELKALGYFETLKKVGTKICIFRTYFQQDNAPVHKLKIASNLQFLQRKRVEGTGITSL